MQHKGIRACILGRRQCKRTRQIRLAPLQSSQLHRDHVRQAQGLAARRNPIRQVPRGLPLGYRSRCNRHLLPMIPEPKLNADTCTPARPSRRKVGRPKVDAILPHAIPRLPLRTTSSVFDERSNKPTNGRRKQFYAPGNPSGKLNVLMTASIKALPTKPPPRISARVEPLK